MTRTRAIAGILLLSLATGAAILLARPPLFTIGSIPDANREPGRTFSYQITHTVDDPTCLAEGPFFSLVEGPSGMTVSPGGLISWTVPGSPNNYTVDVTVKGVGLKWGGKPCYGGSFTAYESFTITVC